MTEAALNITLDPSGALADFERKLAEVNRDTFVALHALEAMGSQSGSSGGADEVSRFANVEIHFFVGGPPTIGVGEVEESRAWICGNGLRAAIDALGILCEDVFRLVRLAPLANGQKLVFQKPIDAGNLTFRDLAGAVLDEGLLARFDRWGLPRKLDELESDVGTLGADTELRSIQQVRNCLTHRHGVVGPEDMDAQGVLIARFRAARLFVTQPKGAPEPLIPGKVFEGGGPVTIQTGLVVERTFAPGKRVRFSIQDFMDILMMVTFAGKELVAKAQQKFAATAVSRAPGSDIHGAKSVPTAGLQGA